MDTPFIYADNQRQERNEAGHKKQTEIFSAFSKGEELGGVEIKYDRLQSQTGNWFVEWINNDGASPSGLQVALKDQIKYWFMVSDTDSLFIEPTALKEHIDEIGYGLMPGIEGSQGYLIPARLIRGWREVKAKGATL